MTEERWMEMWRKIHLAMIENSWHPALLCEDPSLCERRGLIHVPTPPAPPDTAKETK